MIKLSTPAVQILTFKLRDPEPNLTKFLHDVVNYSHPIFLKRLNDCSILWNARTKSKGGQFRRLRMAYNFFTSFNILVPQGDALDQGSPVWVVVYINLPPLATWKISSSSDDPSPRYLLPKLRRFCCRRDGPTQKKTYSKRYVSALPCGDN